MHLAALTTLLIGALLGSILPVTALASELPESEDQVQEIWEEPAWDAGNQGMALWFWSEGARAYQLHGTGSVLNEIKAYDTETLSEVASATLSPPVWGSGGTNEYTTAAGRHHLATVDQETGRVFVAYKSSVDGAAQTAGSQAPCPAPGVAGFPGCVGGLHVLDGATLESLGRIPLTSVSADSPRVGLIPRAMEFAPADPERGWPARVLMIVEEAAAGPSENSPVPGLAAQTQNAVPRRNSANLAYAIALDPESMTQEWTVRLEGCRNSRENRNWFKSPEGYPAAIFRAGGENPSLYVGCHGNPAQQGVVVRVPLDEDGVPATSPVVVSQPDAPGSEPEAPGAEPPAGPVAPAPRQETFAGPDKVTVVIGDPQSRRLLMRVNDAGEVWWVFDGQANQFIGTVGIGDYVHGHTSYALDPGTGRLYVIAAVPLNATGPGGLYLADIRRNPLPQALHYPELADPARHATGLNTSGSTPAVGWAASVMPRSPEGVTRLFQTTSNKGGQTFRRITDTSPVSVDGEPESAVVRTLDLDEIENVTTSTFDGTARGFGFRTILIGGAEGAARGGPADPVGWVRGAPDADGTSESVTTPSGRSRLCGDGAFHPSFTGGIWQNCDNPAVEPFTWVELPPETTAEGGFPLVGSTVSQIARPDACTDAQRELIVAFAGPQAPAVVDASSSRGETQPILADVKTKEDLQAPVTRCAPRDWKALWETALFSQPPIEEPGADWPFEDARSSCTTTSEEEGEAWNDPVVGAFASQVNCSEDEVGGWGQARGIHIEGLSVAHTLSTFRIYRDPLRGIVSRVESIARGIDLGGIVKIDTVRGMAESWANGRTAPEDLEPEGEDEFNPFNCDSSRPAGTCFQRHVFGVTVKDPRGGVAYQCGPCGPEDDFLEAMNRAFGAYGYATFREPDRQLARGSADGYVAAITKKDKERFSDIVLNNDLLETMVPMLEVVRYAPHNRPEQPGETVWYNFGTPPRGRQVFQFAAVEVSSAYGIQCLLVYDEESNTCAEAAVAPGAITVSLADGGGEPLAGGAFELRADADADGVLGLADELVPDGACVTADDGVGTCRFENLPPGGYLINQVAAPPGYAKAGEPFVVELGSGEDRTVAFTNVSNISTIELKAVDEAGNALAGASFAAYPDPDADGKVAPEAAPAATCTTDEQGVCTMQVPAGSYVLVQTAAPGGLEGIAPVPFTFASGGQVAAVTVTNYPPEAAPAAPPPAASPIYTPPVGAAPPMESISEFTPTTPVDVVGPPVPSLPEQVGGTVVQVIRAPGDALRLLARDPKQAVAWTAALALFCLAALAVRRRQAAMALIEG